MENKKYQLPKEFATKWVEALRSGVYEQGVGFLKNTGGYCCLGVACKLQGIGDTELYGKVYPNALDESLQSLLPKSILGDALPYNLIGIVANMNDDEHKSFAEIAEWIESNVQFI